MNRIIKFRVWDKHINQYVKFNPLCHFFNDDSLIFEQFTGLLDQNGKEIYENDIVKQFIEDKEGDFDRITAIKYVKGSYLVEEDDCSTVLSLYHNHIEVIGNLQENPEIL